MQENDPIQPSSPKTSQRFLWGCLVGGCMGVVLLSAIGIVAALAGGYLFYKQQLAVYTSESPRELPVVELTKEEQTQLETRVEQFEQQVEEEQPTEPLVLTEKDLNGLISRDKGLRNRLFVRVEEEQIIADVSIPTDAIPGGKGRYFNGTVAAKVSLVDGQLNVEPTSASVNGAPIPDEVLREIDIEQMLSQVDRKGNYAKRLERFERIVIEDDKLILTPKAPVEPSESDAQTSTATES